MYKVRQGERDSKRQRDTLTHRLIETWKQGFREVERHRDRERGVERDRTTGIQRDREKHRQ